MNVEIRVGEIIAGRRGSCYLDSEQTVWLLLFNLVQASQTLRVAGRMRTDFPPTFSFGQIELT